MSHRRLVRPVDVCHVVALASSSGKYGGPFTSALEQCRIRVSSGLTCTLVAGILDESDRDIVDMVDATLVRSLARSLPVPSLFSFSLLHRLWRLIGQASTTHVSFGRELIPVSAVIIARIRGTRLVIQPHGMLTVGTESRRKDVLDRLVIRQLLQSADIVVALAEDEKQALCERFSIDPERVRVIGNGVDIRQPPYDQAQPRTLPVDPEVLFLGRLHPRKRVADFISAARSGHDPRVRWSVVGPDGGQLPLVLSAADSGWIFYDGAIPPADVAERVNRATIFVLPSISEPWGNVLVSALALGVPVIVTESASLAARIDAAGAGFIVPDYDHNRIRKAADTLLNDPDLYARMSHNAVALARASFSAAAMRDSIVAVSFQRDSRGIAV